MWSWSYGSWIYKYLCNQCLSPLMLWVRISIRVRCTTLCDNVCQWLATGRWFSPGPLVSFTNKTDRHDITEILLKVALNTIKETNPWAVVIKRPSLHMSASDIILRFSNTRYYASLVYICDRRRNGSPLKFWVQTPLMVRCTLYIIM